MKSILSPLQQRVLTGLFDAGLGDRDYYLSGGTGLAAFYLQHRRSDDLDFFTRKKGAVTEDDRRFVIDTLAALGNEIKRTQESAEFARYLVRPAACDEELKIEFIHDAGVRLEAPLRSGSMVVDSFHDLAVKKVCALADRTKPHDLVDLYFILKEKSHTLDSLLLDARTQANLFDTAEGELLVAAKLVKDSPDAVVLQELERFTRVFAIVPVAPQEVFAALTPLGEEIVRRNRPRGGDRAS